MSGKPTAPFWRDEMPDVAEPWLGQATPSSEPSELCSDLYTSPSHHTFCTAFNPQGDELFLAASHPETDKSHIVSTRIEGGRWLLPERAPFDSEWIDNDICMSPDGSRLVWRSWRPLPGETEPQERSILWMVDRTSSGWTEARPVLCGGEPPFGGYPGVAADGTLYFAGRLTPGVGGVFRARREGEMYGATEAIIGGMNAGGDLTIAPDQSFLVIACWRRPDNNGESDLYVSFRRGDDSWTALRNLGSPINNELNENCPMVSSDGKRFFFLRYAPDIEKARTYCISPAVILAHREAALRSEQEEQ